MNRDKIFLLLVMSQGFVFALVAAIAIAVFFPNLKPATEPDFVAEQLEADQQQQFKEDILEMYYNEEEAGKQPLLFPNPEATPENLTPFTGERP